jgi:hypothetical protein
MDKGLMYANMMYLDAYNTYAIEMMHTQSILPKSSCNFIPKFIQVFF